MKEKDTEDNIDGREVLESLAQKASSTTGKDSSDETEASVSIDDNDEEPSLATVIKKQATEEEQPYSRNFALLKILGGDILTTKTLRRQIGVFLIITVCVLAYISSRYTCQQRMIEIDTLERNLKDIRYRALSSSSTLTEMSRESRILDVLKNNGDTLIKVSKQPPYIIEVPQE